MYVKKLLLLKIFTLDLTNDMTNFTFPWGIKACCSLWWFTSPFRIEIKSFFFGYIDLCDVVTKPGLVSVKPRPISPPLYSNCTLEIFKNDYAKQLQLWTT